MDGDKTTSPHIVEAAAKAYATATGYYVEFPRGLSSASADKIRTGIAAALTTAEPLIRSQVEKEITAWLREEAAKVRAMTSFVRPLPDLADAIEAGAAR